MKKYLLQITGYVTCLTLISSCSGSQQAGSQKKAPIMLEQTWATDAVLKTPESVLFDAQRNALYVSNINQMSKGTPDGDGFISKLSLSGQVEQLFWVSGLNDPKGMGVHNSVLYVADKTQVVAISTETGSVIARYDAPGAQDLNDITINASGTVYISDKAGKKIYQLQNGRVSLWLDNTQDQEPNGLFISGNTLMTNYATSGEIKKIDINTKAVTDWIKNVPSADGLVNDGRGNYFASNWNGEIYFVQPDGKFWKVLDTKDQQMNTADIGISTRDQILYVPTFFNNRVVAYRIKTQ